MTRVQNIWDFNETIKHEERMKETKMSMGWQFEWETIIRSQWNDYWINLMRLLNMLSWITILENCQETKKEINSRSRKNCAPKFLFFFISRYFYFLFLFGFFMTITIFHIYTQKMWASTFIHWQCARYFCNVATFTAFQSTMQNINFFLLQCFCLLLYYFISGQFLNKTYFIN